MNQHLSSDRLIAYHRSREDYQQQPQNSLQFGYGDHRYVKFTYQLLNESDILKEKILKQCIEDFSLCENIDLCLLSSDLLSVILKHTSNKNDIIRGYATTAIRNICSSVLGRKHLVKKNCIQHLQSLVNDPLEQIRTDIYDGLLRFAEYTDQTNVLLQSEKILPHLVDKLIQEKNEKILNRTVKLLKVMMQGQVGTPKILKTAGINRLMSLIGSKFSPIRYNVCMTLANISFNQQGKEQIVSKGFIKDICPYLKDQDAYVRQAACLLLCSLAQLNQGKIQILNCCQFETIIGLLDQNKQITLNAVQLIANLAQNPIGRAKSMPYLNKIASLTNIEKKYIQETLQVIKWLP